MLIKVMAITSAEIDCTADLYHVDIHIFLFRTSSSGADMNSQAALLLRKQLAELNKSPVEGFSAGLIDDQDIFRWEVGSLTSCWTQVTQSCSKPRGGGSFGKSILVILLICS